MNILIEEIETYFLKVQGNLWKRKKASCKGWC